jgi:hypothetical protein
VPGEKVFDIARELGLKFLNAGVDHLPWIDSFLAEGGGLPRPASSAADLHNGAQATVEGLRTLHNDHRGFVFIDVDAQDPTIADQAAPNHMPGGPPDMEHHRFMESGFHIV